MLDRSPVASLAAGIQRFVVQRRHVAGESRPASASSIWRNILEISAFVRGLAVDRPTRATVATRRVLAPALVAPRARFGVAAAAGVRFTARLAAAETRFVAVVFFAAATLFTPLATATDFFLTVAFLTLASLTAFFLTVALPDGRLLDDLLLGGLLLRRPPGGARWSALR